MGKAVTAQQAFRFRYDDGSLTTATWRDSQDTNVQIPVDTKFRLRILVEETGSGSASVAAGLQYSYNGGAYTDITGSSTHVQAVDDDNSIADDTAITDFSGITWSGSTANGRYDDNGADTTAVSLSSTYTHFEFCIQLVGAALSNGDTLDFRVYAGGSALSAYSITPRATANVPYKLTAEQGAYSLTGQRVGFDYSGSAFPQIVGTAASQQATNSTSHTVALPDGIQSGELLLAFLALDAGGAPIASFPAGWTEIKDASDATAVVTMAVAYRVADGTEGASISVTSSASCQSAHASYRITGHDSSTNAPEISTGASGDSNTADPDSLTPGGGSDDYLWIAIAAVDGSTGIQGPYAITAAPASYANLVSSESGGADNGATVGLAFRMNTGTSENPGTFSIEGGAEWFAATLAVYPGNEPGVTAYTIVCGQGSFTLSGQAVSLNVSIAIPQGAFTLSGQSVALTKGYRLTADSGSFTLSGQATNLLAARTLPIDQGAFTLSGQAANLLKGYALTAEFGSFSLAGQTLSFINSYVIKPEVGSYTLAGQAQNLLFGRKLTIGQGSFSLSGQDVALRKGYNFVLDPGSFTLSGQSVAFRIDYALIANQGSFALAGQTTPLIYDRILPLSSGSFALAGQAVTLRRGYSMPLSSGSFTLNGQSILLDLSAVLAGGSFTLSGQSVNLIYTPATGYTLTADQGSFTLSGQSQNLLVGRLVASAQGSYVLSGQSVSLRIARMLTAAQGAFSLSGFPAALLSARSIAAAQGSFSLSGQDAGLFRGFALAAQPGSFTLSGQSVPLLVAWKIAAAFAAFSLSGQSVALTYSGQSVEIFELSLFVNIAPARSLQMNIAASIELRSNPSPTRRLFVE